MKTTTNISTWRLAALTAGCSLVVLLIGNRPAAGAALLSDELQIQAPPGAVPPIFDAFIPETGPGAAEAEAIFPPGVVAAIPVPLPPGSIAVILTEPAGEATESGPIIFPGPNGPVFVSDVVISTLNSQATFPPIIALVSDGDPLLAQLVATLPPTTPFIPETGGLQDLTLPLVPGGVFPGFGPVTVLVRSDVTTPEPSSIALLALGCVGFAAWAWRNRP